MKLLTLTFTFLIASIPANSIASNVLYSIAGKKDPQYAIRWEASYRATNPSLKCKYYGKKGTKGKYWFTKEIDVSQGSGVGTTEFDVKIKSKMNHFCRYEHTGTTFFISRVLPNGQLGPESNIQSLRSGDDLAPIDTDGFISIQCAKQREQETYCDNYEKPSLVPFPVGQRTFNVKINEKSPQ